MERSTEVASMVERLDRTVVVKHGSTIIHLKNHKSIEQAKNVSKMTYDFEFNDCIFGCFFQKRLVL